MNVSLRKAMLNVGRFGIAVVLLAWVISRVHWHDYVAVDSEGRQILHMGVASSIKGMDLSLLIWSVVGAIGSQLVVALRWRLLLSVQGIRIGVREASRLTLLAYFVSMAVPGMVGGDLVKAYFVARKTHQKAHVMVSVFVDRLLGICGLTTMAIVMLAIVWSAGIMDVGSVRGPAVAIATAVIAIAVTSVFLLHPPLRRTLRLQKLYLKLPFSHFVSGAGSALDVYRQHARCLIQALGITCVAQIIGIGSLALIGMGLSLSAVWYTYFLYIPLVEIISAVPVTPGAVGVMEELYIFFLASVDSESKILALALLVRLSLILAVLPGAVVAMFWAKLPQTEVVQAELDIGEGHEPGNCHT